MDQVEELKRRLREAEARADREQQRADQTEQARQYERERADQAEQQRQHERERADQAEEKIQLTTFDEYIDACQSLVFSRLAVERNKSLTSKGPLTNPQNKLYPDILEPWPDFLELQRDIFGTLYDALSADARVFESRDFLATLGRRVAKRTIADEKTLEYFMHNSIEDPIRFIMDELKVDENVRREFDMGNGIMFENHPHAISETSEEVIAREAPSTPPQALHQRENLQTLRPDQICVYRSGDGEALETRTMVYICEYKAPHKLTPPHLRAGLRRLDIYKEVVNRKTIPTSADPDGRFQYHAEKLTASALTQTYHYMIEGGLDYGLMTTGEATVFLKIDWAQPGVLYYHLAEPTSEVSAHPEHMQSSSAVGQHLAFSLMAIGRPGERQGHGQDERDRAKLALHTWAEDFETTVRSVPVSERMAPDSGSSWAPTTYENFDRSPDLARKRARKKGRRGRRGEEREEKTRGRDQSDTSEGESGPPDTPTPSGRRGRRGQQGQCGRGDTEPRRSQRIMASRPRQSGTQEAERPFCTQACLLGLVRGGLLDPACPNIGCHSKAPRCHDDAHHLISHTTWLQLLREQLQQTLDAGVTKLGKHGARGVLFKVTLLAYGYTVACKGTIQAFVSDLEHEAAVYKRLEPIQGINVPVFLGAVDLRPLKRTYYYDHRVYIVHMTFLSWGGDCIYETELVGDDDVRRMLKEKALMSLRAIHREGVVHGDVRCPNMLVNRETDGVMVIDFERAELLRPGRRRRRRRALAPLVPNKRGWDSHDRPEKRGGPAKRQGTTARSGGYFAEDAMMARAAFEELEIIV